MDESALEIPFSLPDFFIACSPICPHPSFCWQVTQMAEEDVIFWHWGLALNKGKHSSETVSAAVNVTVGSPDECDFWQMNIVRPSAVQQVMHPHYLHLQHKKVYFTALHTVYANNGGAEVCNLPTSSLWNLFISVYIVNNMVLSASCLLLGILVYFLSVCLFWLIC